MTGSKRGDAWAGMGVGWAITATLVAGMAVCGGIGFLIDVLLGSGRAFTGIGIVVGGALGIYIVYLQYGRGDHDEG